MKRSALRRRPKPPTPEHVAATALARKSKCLICGERGTCVPAHWPHHRGSGGKWANEWARELWVPACGEPGACHQLIDRQLGVSEAIEKERQKALRILEVAAPAWWEEEGE